MKANKTDSVKLLHAEADRFTQLAKDSALQLLGSPTADWAPKKKRQAEDHMVRAESFNAAAALIL